MLINCPKCGFQQPKDKYCAQCGVDMETFKPATPPLFQRIFGNYLVQLGLLAVIAGGVGTYLYSSRTPKLAEQSGSSRSLVQINKDTGAPAPASANMETDLEPVQADTQAQQTDAASNELAARADIAAPAAALTETTGGEEKRKVASATGPSLVVTYAEVPQAALQTLIDATHSGGNYMSFNMYSAGLLPGLRERLSSGNFKMTVLHKETRSLSGAKTLQWFQGLKDPRSPAEIGFTTFVTLNDPDPNDNSLRGTMEVQRGWREVGPNGFEYQRRSFPAEFEITPRTGFFMVGVMPPRSNIPNDDELTAIDVFKILRSPAFQRGESEFVIFVEFARDSN